MYTYLSIHASLSSIYPSINSSMHPSKHPFIHRNYLLDLHLNGLHSVLVGLQLTRRLVVLDALGDVLRPS
jgi:hypothetical protein